MPPPSEPPEITATLITSLRDKFLNEANTNPDFYCDEDINEIRERDRWLTRYLRVNKCNVDESLKGLITSMKWRKTTGINTMSETDFPLEYYQIGGIFAYGKDLNGSVMVLFRVKVNKKFNEWTEILKKFFLFIVEQQERRTAKGEITGITIVFDCNNAGITNVDIDLLSFIVSTLRDYYPGLLTSVLVNELPWILQWVFKLVQSWLPEDQQKLIHLVNQKDLTTYVSGEELPDFMGGKNAASYRNGPKNAPTVLEFAEKRNFKKKEAEKLLKHLEPYLNGQ